MQRTVRALVIPALAVATCLAVHADGTIPSQSSEVQLQLGNEFFSEGRYQDALDAYPNARTAQKPAKPGPGRPGMTQPGYGVPKSTSPRTQPEPLTKPHRNIRTPLALTAAASGRRGCSTRPKRGIARRLR